MHTFPSGPLALLAHFGNSRPADPRLPDGGGWREATPSPAAVRSSAQAAGQVAGSGIHGTQPRGLSTLRTKFSVLRAIVSETTEGLAQSGLPRPALVPVRESRPRARCLFLEEGGLACIMELTDDGQGVTRLRGQVLHDRIVGDFSVELWADGVAAPLATVDAHKLGYFSLPSVPAGDWTLVIRRRPVTTQSPWEG